MNNNENTGEIDLIILINKIKSSFLKLIVLPSPQIPSHYKTMESFFIFNNSWGCFRLL